MWTGGAGVKCLNDGAWHPAPSTGHVPGTATGLSETAFRGS